MKKRTKLMKVFALILVFATLLSACGTEPATPEAEATTPTVEEEVAEVEDEYPEYLNLDSAYPIVKDEYADEITLTAVILMQDNAGDWEDLWISKYFKEKYNVNLEVEYISLSNRDEKKNLYFSSGELPDLLINWYLSSDEIVRYGTGEEMLLQMDQYMNETLTPNVLKYFDGQIASACTSIDGHVYTLPNMSNPLASGNFKRCFINEKWLKDLGLEMPKTLDEFVEAMYAIKEADPAGVGSENLYPFGSGDKSGKSNGWYLLNALGYVDGINTTAGDSYGLEPCIRDGEAVIPVYDMEVYQEYLKIMNQFYNDGIINPTYFTIEDTEMNAQMVEGKTAMYHNAPYTAGIENYEEFVAAYPLTSDWQTEPEFRAPDNYKVGHIAVSADTEYPELCMRFIDMFYNNETDCAYLLEAAGGSEWNMGYDCLVLDETSGQFMQPNEIGQWAYHCESIAGNSWMFGAISVAEAGEKYAEIEGYTDYEVVDGNYTGTGVWKNSIITNVVPYAITGFPSIYYTSLENGERINELKTLIKPYVEEQVALFITGRRPLSETEDFVKELEELGIGELQDLYKGIYDSVAK